MPKSRSSLLTEFETGSQRRKKILYFLWDVIILSCLNSNTSLTWVYSEVITYACFNWRSWLAILFPESAGRVPSTRFTVNSSNVNFTSKISLPPEPVFKAWDSKCLALIAQMVRAFGMNPKVGGLSPSQVEAFTVLKTLTLSQEHPFVCRKWMLLPTHS